MFGSAGSTTDGRRFMILTEVNGKVAFRRLGIGRSYSCSQGKAESSTVTEMGGTTSASSFIPARVSKETWSSCVVTELSAATTPSTAKTFICSRL